MMKWVSVVAGAALAMGGWVHPTRAQERIAILSEPGTPIVTTELLLTVGPADETTNQAGLAYLAARSVLAQVRPALDSIGARADVAAHKDGLSFSVWAAPEVWEEATRTMLVGVFREPPESAVVLRERAAISAELRGRLANPADAAVRALDRAFFGASHPWGRPTVGTPETVDRLTPAQVAEFLVANFTPDRAYAAIVGPVEEAEARAYLRSVLGSVFPSPIEQIPRLRSDRLVRQDYNSVTSWVSTSYSFPETADEEAIRFVVFLTADALSFSPAQRSVYNVWSEVVPRVGGGEIRIQVVVPPEEASGWALRLEETVAEMSSESMLEDVFEGYLRRYRGERIMSLIAPEDRAREAARQLLVHGRVLGVIPDLDGMTQQRVQAAAAGLESPTIVILGPILN
jgi:predicted Zn-dependent peptidase